MKKKEDENQEMSHVALHVWMDLRVFKITTQSCKIV